MTFTPVGFWKCRDLGTYRNVIISPWLFCVSQGNLVVRVNTHNWTTSSNVVILSLVFVLVLQ
jgi:hypothetical protein